MIFRKNPNLERQLRSDPSFKFALKSAAEPAARQARLIGHSIMPRNRGNDIRVVTEGDEVVIANFDHGGHLDEYGSVKNPSYAPLRKGVRQAGLRLEER